MEESIHRLAQESVNFKIDKLPSTFEKIIQIPQDPFNPLSGKRVCASFKFEEMIENKADRVYLALVKDILETGQERADRTGVGTISKFGVQMRFPLQDGFPLLTTKRMFWRGIVEELLWFISGSTDANKLSERGVKIWDANGSRAFLDRNGFFEREVGDLGPIYGFQWRHFGAKYTDMHADYTGQGVDQLQTVIKAIQQNPNDRRIIMSAWNPPDLQLSVLPPCHMMCQFYVQDNHLSCMLVMRSGDIGLGVPFNIASYALLTQMIAHVCRLQAHELIVVVGDAHIYQSHIAALTEQLTREPKKAPQVYITRKIDNIDDFRWTDFELRDYESHPAIPMEMAV